MKLNRYSVVGIMYIVFSVGLALGDVGDTPSSCEPFEWYMPILVGMMLVFPFILGYTAGSQP